MKISSPLCSSVVLFLANFIVSPGIGQEPCFQTVQAPPWEGEDIGAVRFGASRPVQSPADVEYELCSISTGLGEERDALRYLFQPTRADFELTARLERLQGGLGGLMASLDFRMEESASVAIAVHMNAAGGFSLFSSFRENTGEKAGPGNSQPVPIGLPCYLKVRRQGAVLTTSYSRDNQTFIDHLQVIAGTTGLGSLALYAGMVQASENPQIPATALFVGPVLTTRETFIPPRLDRADPPIGPIEGGLEVTLRGALLDGVEKVTLAGIPADILRASEGEVTVLSKEAPGPMSGDVVVTTKTGSAAIEGAFVYAGRRFIRGDVNGDQKIDIGDVVAELFFFFLNGRPPLCLEVADVDGDSTIGINDPIDLLYHLYLDGPAPPAPYPLPGISDLPCGLAAPVVTRLSQDVLKEGDLVTIFGQGFSQPPERNVVFFGETSADVIDGSADMLVAKVGPVAKAGDSSLSVISDYSMIPIPGFFFRCYAKACVSKVIGVHALATNVVAHLIQSNLPPLSAGHPLDAKSGTISLAFDRRMWDPSQSYGVSAGLLLPAVQKISRGSLSARFEYRNFTPEIQFEEWLQGLATELQDGFSGGGLPREVMVRPDFQSSSLLIQLDDAVIRSLEVGSSWIDSSVIVALGPPKGTCGPEDLDPVADRRAFGWCRFQELIEDCDGFPSWQYFVPYPKLFLTSGAIFRLPSPDHFSPDDMDALYNSSAYCHIRQKGLYKRCILDDMATAGKKRVPEFPRSAIVVKTRWVKASELIAEGKDPSKHYSYVYTGDGQRYYLVLFHFTTKDVDNWYWADFYVPPAAGAGGCGGSGSDRPGAITGVWANYEMCTSLDASEGPTACGNNTISVECTENCVSCHTRASHGSLKTDFLYSLEFKAISGPPACP